MNTGIRKGAALVLGVVLSLFSQASWSIGLGDARVQSFLDQPLEVDIELITQSGDNLDAISVGLASAADYELIGASRNDISVPLRFSIEGSPGSAKIVVRSQLAVNNPVVRLIIEVNSASGRMLREFTLFLDPATFSQPAPAPEVTKVPAKARPTSPANDSESSGDSTRTASSSVTPERQGSFTGANEYGPVQSGETLWRIAKDWSDGTGLGINQVMVAIQRNNPQAFSKGNINLLQRGAILRMPARDEVESIPTAEANGEVRDQTSAFQMRQDVTSASTPLLVDENTAPQAVQPVPEPSPEPQPALEPEAEPATLSEAEETPADATDSATEESGELTESNNLALDFEPQLELVPPSEDSEQEAGAGVEETEDASVSTGSDRDLREELARKEEELINQQQQNEYLEQRLKELESQVAASEAAAVEDNNLASMEQRLQQERQAQAEKEDTPWYSGLTLLWIGLLVAVAALVGWFMSRRGIEVDDAGSSEALRDIQDEAEEVLRVLDSDSPAESTPGTVEEPVEEESDSTEESDADETVIAPFSAKEQKGFGPADDEAEVLDEESADPEIQLDLARAYISMGDKEAARVILEEVVANGSEAQQAEATKMKNLL